LLIAAAKNAQPVTHPDLPFDVRVDKWMPNSNIQVPREDDMDGTWRTKLLTYPIVQIAPFSGAGDEASRIDVATAHLTLSTKAGEPVGSTIVSGTYSNQGVPRRIEVAGKMYDVYLRFKR